MAVVSSRGQRVGNLLAIAAVIVVTVIMLAPIYWIMSTSLKPRNLATTTKAILAADHRPW